MWTLGSAGSASSTGAQELLVSRCLQPQRRGPTAKARKLLYQEYLTPTSTCPPYLWRSLPEGWGNPQPGQS